MMIKKLDYVTNGHLVRVLEEHRIGILREVRVMMFELMKTMEVYYEEQAKRRMTALSQGFEDKLLHYKDGVKMLSERIDNHEIIITQLQTINL